MQASEQQVRSMKSGIQVPGLGCSFALRQQQADGWRAVFADLHAGVLRQQGFVDLDPKKCFDEVHSFAKCCSVGDLASFCKVWCSRL